VAAAAALLVGQAVPEACMLAWLEAEVELAV